MAVTSVTDIEAMAKPIRAKLRWMIAAGFLFIPALVFVRVYKTRVTDDALMRAVKAGNASRVVDLLKHGANPNVYESTYESGDSIIERLRSWLSPSRKGKSVLEATLYIQSGSSHDTIVEKLIEAGANPDDGGKTLDSALRRAAIEENLNLMVLLLNHGARVDMPDEDGNTALMGAVRRGSLGSIRLLLSKNADPNRRDGEGMSSLEIALTSNGTEEQREEIVRELLEHGADAKGKNYLGESILELTIASHISDERQTYIAQMLLEHGADPNQSLSSNPQMSLISFASNQDRPNVAALLCKCGKKATLR